jgi:drug/metabolite transporter (DMT)-like permease
VDKKVTEPRENALVRFFRDRGVQYRLAALVISATEAVFLKKALLASSPIITFTLWALLGFAFAAPLVIALMKRAMINEQLTIARRSASIGLSLVLTTGLMQFCTILAFAGFQVGYALALFQTSALLSVLLGHRIFNEPNLLERLIGSLIMIAGAILIIMAR